MRDGREAFLPDATRVELRAQPPSAEFSPSSTEPSPGGKTPGGKEEVRLEDTAQGDDDPACCGSCVIGVMISHCMSQRRQLLGLALRAVGASVPVQQCASAAACTWGAQAPQQTRRLRWPTVGHSPSACHTRRCFASAAAVASSQDFYDVLGVDRSANDAEIKRAYFAKAKELHPDTNSGDPAAQEKFQQVQRAYEVLKDKEKRQIYDQVGPERYDAFESGGGGGGGGGGMGGGMGGNPFGGGFGFQQHDFADIDDIFSEFFGGRGPFQRSMRGQNLAVEVRISFEEAAFGCTKNLSVDLPSPERRGGVETRELDLRVPAGVSDMESMRLRGEGARGPPGVAPGDLIVQVRVRPHPVFRREGPHLHMNVELGITQAVLGGRVRVPTLDEGDLVVKVRPGTQPDEVHKLRGKGVPVLGQWANGVGPRGNLYLRYKVHIPSSVTGRQRELLEEFQSIEDGDHESDQGS